MFVVDMILLCRIDLNYGKEPTGTAQDGMEEFIPDLEKHLIRKCGHSTQTENQEEVILLMSDWQIRRFRSNNKNSVSLFLDWMALFRKRKMLKNMKLCFMNLP